MLFFFCHFFYISSEILVILGALGRILGALWAVLAPLGGVLGGSRGPLGSILEAFGARPGAVLEHGTYF